MPSYSARLPEMTSQLNDVAFRSMLASLSTRLRLPVGSVAEPGLYFTLNPKLAFFPAGAPLIGDVVRTQPPPVAKVDGSKTGTTCVATVPPEVKKPPTTRASIR